VTASLAALADPLAQMCLCIVIILALEVNALSARSWLPIAITIDSSE